MSSMFGYTGSKRTRPVTQGLTKDDVLERLRNGGYEKVVQHPLFLNEIESSNCRLSKITLDALGFIEIGDFSETKVDIDTIVPDMISVSEGSKQAVLSNIDKKKDRIKEFLLKEIVPMDFAIDLSFDEVKQEMDLIVGQEVGTAFAEVRDLMSKALYIKTLIFIAKEIDLPDEYVKGIIETAENKKKAAVSLQELLARAQAKQGSAA